MQGPLFLELYPPSVMKQSSAGRKTPHAIDSICTERNIFFRPRFGANCVSIVY